MNDSIKSILLTNKTPTTFLFKFEPVTIGNEKICEYSMKFRSIGENYISSSLYKSGVGFYIYFIMKMNDKYHFIQIYMDSGYIKSGLTYDSPGTLIFNDETYYLRICYLSYIHIKYKIVNVNTGVTDRDCREHFYTHEPIDTISNILFKKEFKKFKEEAVNEKHKKYFKYYKSDSLLIFTPIILFIERILIKLNKICSCIEIDKELVIKI